MKLVKYLLIGFLVVQASWLVSMEPDDGGVTESKTISVAQDADSGIPADVGVVVSVEPASDISANDVKLLADGSLEIFRGGDSKVLVVPRAIWRNFGLLESFFAPDFAFNRESFKTENLEYLYTLFKVLQPTTDLKSYSIPDLISLVYYADHLLIKDWGLLNGVLQQIKQAVTPDQLVRLNFPEINVPFLLKLNIDLDYLTNVAGISWVENGQSFWVSFNDYTVQFYNSFGEINGELLTNVDQINCGSGGQNCLVRFRNGNAQIYNIISGKLIGTGAAEIFLAPDGQNYFAKLEGNRAQRYDIAGKAVGDLLNGVYKIYWAPDGQHYLVLFFNTKLQLYNVDGEKIGSSEVRGVSSKVYWAPNGQHYLVLFLDKNLQLYSANGEEVGRPLNIAVDFDRLTVSWAPDGQSYFVMSSNGKAQLYNIFGSTIGTLLESVDKIYWAPNGRYYFVNFLVGYPYESKHPQICNLAGEEVVKLPHFVTNVIWSPNGSDYLAILGEKTIIQNYNVDSNMEDKLLKNVKKITWAPDSQSYFVVFENGTVKKFGLFDLSKLDFGKKLIIQAIWNEFKLTKKPVMLPLSLRVQLPAKIQEELIKFGYMSGYLFKKLPEKLLNQRMLEESGTKSATMAAILKRQAKS